MDTLLVLLVFVVAGIGWQRLSKSMRMNNRPWWVRHTAGAVCGFLALLGLSILLDGFGLLGDDGFDLFGVILGLLFLLPLAVAITRSRAAQARISNSYAESTLGREFTAIDAAQSSSECTPASTMKVTLELNQGTAKASADPAPEPDTLTGHTTSPQVMMADYVRQKGGGQPSTNGALVFVYTDSRGQVTTRELTAWRYDGTYIKGFCLDQEDIRTFRRDRIGPFISGEELLDQRLERKSFGSSSDRLFSDTDMEVLFTGFAADDRLDLENAARDAGITVRSTVTKNLTYLCAGPRAGATKLRQAGERGAMVLDEEQFRHMIDTGELLDY